MFDVAVGYGIAGNIFDTKCWPTNIDSQQTRIDPNYGIVTKIVALPLQVCVIPQDTCAAAE